MREKEVEAVIINYSFQSLKMGKKEEFLTESKRKTFLIE